MKTVKLMAPLSKEDTEGLELGDIVYFSGEVYTCRGLFQRRVIDEGIAPPIDTEKMNVMIHAGPVMIKKDGKWEIVSMQPTTSNRYEKWGAKTIEKLKIRAIVGKGTMGEQTAEACKEHGCVHLTPIGVTGALLPTKARVKTVHWYELGPIEALWILEADELGPFMVDIDTKGNRYFAEVNTKIREQAQNVYKKLGIPGGFEYTDLTF